MSAFYEIKFKIGSATSEPFQPSTNRLRAFFFEGFDGTTVTFEASWDGDQDGPWLVVSMDNAAGPIPVTVAANTCVPIETWSVAIAACPWLRMVSDIAQTAARTVRMTTRA